MTLDRRSLFAAALAGGASTIAGAATANEAERTTAREHVRMIGTEEAFWITEMDEPMRRAIERHRRDMGVPGLRWLYGDPAFHPDRASPMGLQQYREMLDLGDGRIAKMDAAGIDMHLLSLGSPGVQMLQRAEAVAMARLANDKLAEAVQRHPTRFTGLASFAPQDPAAAVREMDRAINTLKLNGFIVNSHTNNLYLDDPQFWPILEAAEALDAPLYIHPRPPSRQMAEPFRDYGHPMMMFSFGLEVSTHIMRLIYSGALDRFPQLKIVIGHMGEALPFWLWRVDRHNVPASAGEGNRNELPPSGYFARQIYITTSGMFDPLALRYSIDKIGADHVLFAIDVPFEDSRRAADFLNNTPLTEQERNLVAHGNAERIFKIRAVA